MEPIAVVGFGLRFPHDAVSPETFWDLLMERKCASSDWPRDRINITAFKSSVPPEPSSIAARGAHFLREDPGLFDAPFFSITAPEAAALDPQQCLLLETTYQAFENAGIPLDTLRGSKTGVYVGTMCDDHKHQILKDVDKIPTYAATGSSSAVLANRISWFFDLTGPSITLDTACSSSLIALHIACHGLSIGETSMAVVGGCNVLCGVEAPIAMTRMGFLSPDGRCFSFDERANGYARGEGVGVIILKRLSDAISHNDTIRAVIRSTGTNQDGYTPGITVPNQLSQARLIRETYEKAGLDFTSTGYFESHGTGTAVGDPLEAAAISHLEGGSGVAGLIKTILVLEKGVIPPNANFERLSSRIPRALNLEQFPISPIQWSTTGVRRASVNSFGFGGSNAHVIVDDADGFFRDHGLVGHHSTNRDNAIVVPNGIEDSSVRCKVLVWSANRDVSLSRMTEAFAKHFQAHGVAEGSHHLISNLAYTLSCRRTHHDWRSYAIVESGADLKTLYRFVSNPARTRKRPALCFLFTGQGAQYKRMGLQLLAYPVFYETLQLCDTVYAQLGSKWSLLDILNNEDDSKNIDHPSYSQPLSTALQVALLELLATFNIIPASVAGHSSGEIVAAYAAGGVSLESACKLSYFRGQLAGSLVDSASESTMLAVALSASGIIPYMDRVSDVPGRLSIACINSPCNVTLGGSRQQVLHLKELLDGDDIFCRELKTGVAYHTSQMAMIADSYRQAIGRLHPGPRAKRSAAMASSVTGDWIPHPNKLCDANYWVRNMVQPVRFVDALTTLLQPPPNSEDHVEISEVVEVGAHSALQRPVTEVLESIRHGARYSSVLSRFDTSPKTTLDLAGRLYCSGFPVRLDKVNGIDMTHEAKYKCLSNLPAYTFSHARYAPRYSLAAAIRHRPHFPSSLLGAPELEWTPLEPRWRRNLNTQQFPWLDHHQINGVTLFPAAGMVAVALEAAYHTAKKDIEISGICIKEATFINPIIINTSDETGTDIKTSLRSTSDASRKDSSISEVRIYVRQHDNWNQTFQGTVQVEYEGSALSQELSSGIQARQSRWQNMYTRAVETCSNEVKTSTIYPHLSRMGMQYGSTFQGLDEVYCDNIYSAVGRITARKMQDLSSTGAEHYFVHPAVLDSLLHLAWIIRSDGATKPIVTSVPARLQSIWFSKDWLRGNNMAGKELRTCNTAVAHGFGGLSTSAIVVNEAGAVIMAMDQLQTTMSSRDHVEYEQSTPKRLCYGLETKPDIQSLEPTQFKSILRASESPLVVYLDLIKHKNPEASILDLTSDGEALDAYFGSQRVGSSPTFGKYDLSDVSKKLAERIRKQYASEYDAGYIRFIALDLESHDNKEDSKLNSYDVVIFSTTQFSSMNEPRALKHVRELLRPGSKLIEFVSAPAVYESGGGCNSPKLTHTNWSEMLFDSGFSIIDAVVEPFSFQGVGKRGFVVSTTANSQISTDLHADFIIVIEDSPEQQSLAQHLKSRIMSRWNVQTVVMVLSQLSASDLSSKARIIFLPEAQRSFLASMSEVEFTNLKHLLSFSHQICWITKGEGESEPNPSLGMVHGIARVLRSENPSWPFMTVSLEHSSTEIEDADTITKLMGLSVASEGPGETEYLVKEGVIQVQRIIEERALDDILFAKTVAQERHMSLNEAGPVELEIQSPGVFDSLRCVPIPPLKPTLGDDEVEVQVHAFGLNFKDVVIALGKLPQNKLGCECAGIITMAGCNARLKPGTRVMMAQNGCMKTLNRCHQDLVVEIPSSLSFAEAAAIPIAGATAYYSLVEQARLRQNETVLIHSGAGATGQMCIQIALLIGAKVYTTVGSHEKREFLMWRYGLKVEQIFYSRDTSFATSIMAATQNQCVDVVVNSLEGDRLHASWEVVAPFGRFIELGRTEIISNSKLAMAHFAKNISFIAVAVDDMVTLRPALVQRSVSAVANLIAEGKLNLPYPLQTYPLSTAEQAFRHLMSGKSTGKLVLNVDPADEVKTYSKEASARQLSPDATYLIAGGFGGLGRSAARWMVSKGARKLILLSRSGPVSKSARLLVDDLRGAGVRVAARACDIANEADLAAVLVDCAKDMPPVRGCLQGTMALRDALFENMTYADWTVSIRSKVLASANLDKLLPSGMDFLVMFSSLSGIVGLPGQANYAAGNTFQDALAHARNQRGESAVSLDLGAMKDVGVIAENEGLGHLAKAHLLSVNEHELHALLDHYCLPPSGIPESRVRGQLLVGLPTSHFMQSNGGEVPAAYAQPLFSRLRVIERDEAVSSSAENKQANVTDYGKQFQAASSLVEAATVVVDGLVNRLSQALSMSAEDIEPTKPLHQYGVDSLIAVEMRNWFAKEFASNVAIFTFLGAPSILAVGKLVADASMLRQESKR
ncbi:ketoacyl-synt-domain-containing protein [Bimuria novae-zelandiae CBS 107.79]|uniref:Ketoacyl-synt-domain-containing protein n=1 Tax=Bimuria novae-zelandiae CBS 107.79 TaxID=1447943 RepID=A0A6A5USI4_9PLEO|nr:ketoacyl-synt-domain-containing protein [Bimuria novae-zelandiae CBS 107.79]